MSNLKKQEKEYYDKSIKIDFEIPEYLKKTIKNLIRERKKGGLDTDFYEEDLISECNQAYNEGIFTMDQVQLIRAKYIG